MVKSVLKVLGQSQRGIECVGTYLSLGAYVHVSVRGWVPVFTRNTHGNIYQHLCAVKTYTSCWGRFIRSSERPAPHLWLVVASDREDLLHSGPGGHTGIDLRDRMTSRERDTATGS